MQPTSPGLATAAGVAVKNGDQLDRAVPFVEALLTWLRRRAGPGRQRRPALTRGGRGPLLNDGLEGVGPPNGELGERSGQAGWLAGQSRDAPGAPCPGFGDLGDYQRTRAV